MYLKGTIDVVKMFAYIAAQIVGGVLALATWKILNNK
jgi:glycerol uptake facilitator-like aquaporin